MELLDGKKYSKEILRQIQLSVEDRVRAGRKPPRLDMILVGEDFASERYVEIKERTAKKVGFEGVVHRFPATVSEPELLAKIDELNAYDPVTGFMVQLPLPESIDRSRVLNAISPEKDVDGLTAVNLGLLFQGDERAIASATPLGIMLLLDRYNVQFEGKHVVIIGNTQVVGLPLLAMLNSRWATVTLCHEKTKGLEKICKGADIIVSAVGKADLITAEFVKEGTVVVDVGVTRDDNGKLSGDVDFEAVSKKASFITPVPGGVGPMTVAGLMLNAVGKG